MITNGEKFACESCIRGHRVTKCQHTGEFLILQPVTYRSYADAKTSQSDRPLQQVGKKGRPVSQCGHCRSLRTSRSVHTTCKCGLTSRLGTREQIGRGVLLHPNAVNASLMISDHCRCHEGDSCICAYKNSELVASEDFRMMSCGKYATPSATPSATSSPAISGHGVNDIFQGPLPAGDAGSAGTVHLGIDADITSHVLSHTGVDNWSFDSLMDASMMSSDSHWADFASLDTQDWMGTLNPVTGIGTDEPAYMAVPNLDDPLSTTEPSHLLGFSGNLSQEQQFHTDSGQLIISTGEIR